MEATLQSALSASRARRDAWGAWFADLRAAIAVRNRDGDLAVNDAEKLVVIAEGERVGLDAPGRQRLDETTATRAKAVLAALSTASLKPVMDRMPK